jgi:hypothetical protein
MRGFPPIPTKNADPSPQTTSGKLLSTVPLGEAKGASVPEWGDVVAMQDKVAPPPRGWSDIHPAVDDLIEAVYDIIESRSYHRPADHRDT